MKQRSRFTLLACVLALAACSKPPRDEAASAALASAPSLVPALPTPVAPEHVAGKRVFDQTCGLCHGAGVAGAPRPGDKASWAPRIAQGTETLYRHALEGYSGATGYMPPRGGAGLPDADVKAGVDYMVALSR